MSKQQTDAGQSPQEVTALEPGKAMARDLSGEQKHGYQLTLAEGQYAGLVIRQRGIEVVIIVIAPDSKQLMRVSPQAGKRDTETFSFIAVASGEYRLTVQAAKKDAPAGGYEIMLEELRLATDKDRNLQEAERLHIEVQKLMAERKYDLALPLAEKALSRYEKELGTENANFATALNSVGEIHRAKGDYDIAETFLKKSLEIYQRVYEPDKYDIGIALNNLAFLYYTKGEYAKAELLYQRALVIYEKRFGANAVDNIAVLNNLAALYRDQGDYTRSEPLLQSVLEIRKHNLKAGDPGIASALNNLAVLLRDKGDYAKSEELLQQALELYQKAFGEHPLVANTLNNLAALYRAKGELNKAEEFLQRALDMLRKNPGEGHPSFALSLDNLATIYQLKGDFDKAGALSQRALTILEKAAGQESRVAAVLNNLGELYRRKGEYDKAEPFLKRALAIRENRFGVNHPDVATVLGNLASLYVGKNDFAQGLAFRKKYLIVREKNISANIYTGSERQKLAYLDSLSGDLNAVISLNIQSLPHSAEAKSMALTLILNRKGRTLDAMTDTMASLRHRAKPGDTSIVDELSETRTRLATLTLKGPGGEGPEKYKQTIRSLEDKREKLEDEMSRRSAEFRSQIQPITLDAMRASLPENAALIEFITFRPFHPKSAANDKSASEPRYIAYLLRRQGEIQWKDLGEAKAIEAMIDKLRQALRDPKRKDIEQLARLVDEKIMQPVRDVTGGATHLLISPDGALNLIPFEALLDEQGRYLVERHSFTYLTSGRDLLRMQVARESKSAPIIVADPFFGEPAIAQVTKAETPKVKPAALSRKRQSVTSGRDLSSVYFAPLGGTAGEARLIKSLFAEAHVLTGVQATESAVKLMNVPRILHIATHGFFLQDVVPAETSNEQRRSISASARIENPLLRSGLALAGANLPNTSADDGILTALEASGLNLWGTKLVTLSACDTGIGEVKDGEGVYGLRRAFVLAGAESLVMSLWPVSDYVTREMMTAYYKGLRQGQGRGEALRQVQLAMLKRKERQHPFYWASFIQSGEWANLDGRR
jgi:CHAT domain-containing protein/Tfp pilus assembly protein PilF